MPVLSVFTASAHMGNRIHAALLKPCKRRRVEVTLKIPIPTVDPNPSWAPDGKSILYVDVTNGVGNIWSAPLDGKPPRKLTAFDADQIFAFDVSPDNRLAISRGSVVRDVVLIKNVR